MTREETSLPNTEFTTATGNYETARAPIDRVVIHSTVGTLQSAIARFGQVGSQVSAHYIVDRDGKLYQGLEEYYTAYHSGNYVMNKRSIGIEHVWYQGAPPTEELYKTAGALVKDICAFYQLPINRVTVIPHKEVVATGCPNEIDVDKIIREANGASAPVDDCPAKLAQITAERDRLNGVIASKDQQISKMASDTTLLQSQYNTLALKEQECQKQTSIYKEAYDALPSLKEQVAHLEASKKAQAEQISDLTRQVSYWTTKYNNLKKPGLKFLQAAMIAICEKLGVQV